jgi:hypothetical protein
MVGEALAHVQGRLRLRLKASAAVSWRFSNSPAVRVFPAAFFMRGFHLCVPFAAMGGAAGEAGRTAAGPPCLCWLPFARSAEYWIDGW